MRLDRKYVLDYSLLGQDLGCIIFLYCFCRKYNINTSMVDSYLDRMFAGVLTYNNVGSYCNGLAGLGIGLKILEEENFIQGVDSVLDNIDIRIERTPEFEIVKNNIDFLHGFIGVAFYLLSRISTKKEFVNNYIDRMLSFLFSTAIEESGMMKWELKEDDDKKYNISLSHGYSSLIILLSRLLENKNVVALASIKKILDETVSYVLSQRIDENKYGSCFPTFSKDSEINISRSRLSWCYGDLGIALALREAALSVKNVELYNIAMSVLRYSANRRAMYSNGLFDGCICHGISGVALIFDKIYNDTNENIFKRASIYWNDLLLKKTAVLMNGVITFPYYNIKNPKWAMRYGILDGLSGIGLYLLGDNRILNKLLIL